MADADVKFRTTRVALNTTTGTQDITLSGFGTPKAAIVLLSSGSADDTVTAGANFSIGFTDGTAANDRASVIHSADNVLTSDTGRNTSSANFGRIYNGTGSTLTVFDFDSWITDGIRINITFASGTNVFATFILIGGADVTNAYAGVKQLTGTSVSVTDPGFESDLVFSACNGNSNINLLSVHAIQSLGISHNDGTDANRSVLYYDVSGQTTSTVGTYLSTSKCCGQIFNGAVNWLGDINTYTASGFTVTSTASPGNDYILYLALKFQNEPDIKLFHTDGPTTTGNKAYTDPGFTSDFGINILSGCTSVDTLQQTGQDGFGVYAFDATNDYSNSISSQDGQSTTNTGSITSSGKIKDLNSGTTILHEGTFTSFDATGWTFNFTTAPGTARKWIGLAIGPNASGGGFTLVADSGSYTLSGTLVDLKADRNVVADSGGYSLTGTDIGLAVGYKTLAESGTYNLTGTAINLKADRMMQALSGSYSLTGTDVGLAKGYRAATDTGSYLINGTATGLVVDRNILAESGSFILTGTAQDLIAAKKILTQSGSYSLTGTDVNLIYTPTSGAVIVVDSGTFSLTGTDIGFVKASKLPVDPGAYLLSGTDVNLAVGRKLATDPGGYSLAGTDLVFALSRKLISNPGSYTLTGTDVTLTYSGEEVIPTPLTRTLSIPSTPRSITITFEGRTVNI